MRSASRIRRVPRPSALAVYSEVVDLVRLHLLDNADQVGGIGQVAVMEDEVAMLHVWILVEMIDPVGIEQ